MKRYQNHIDALLGAMLLLGQFTCVLILGATAAWFINAQKYGGVYLPGVCLMAAPFVFMFVGAWLLRRELFCGGYSIWAYKVAVFSTILSMCFAFFWFQDPMHDIALWFGSHGRWGCYEIQEDGMYYIRDATVPWILFAPIVAAILLHWRVFGRANNCNRPKP
jgi:hypothetical protein